jgi:hypothetical protein
MKNCPIFSLTPILIFSIIVILTLAPLKLHSQEQTKEETTENSTENGRKIYLRSPYIYNVAEKDSDIYAAFQNSFVEQIYYAFDIRAFGKDSSAVIDVTDMYAKDAITFGLAEMKKVTIGRDHLQLHLQNVNAIINSVKSTGGANEA